MRVSVFLVVLVAGATYGGTQEGALYLHNAISELKNLNSLSKTKTVDVPNETRKIHRADIPPLTLTKGELTALYETAISKGNAVKIDHIGGPSVQAAVHHLSQDHPIWMEDELPEHTTMSPPEHKPSEEEGYYYYYYPLKSFMDEMKSSPPFEVSKLNYQPVNVSRNFTNWLV